MRLCVILSFTSLDDTLPSLIIILIQLYKELQWLNTTQILLCAESNQELVHFPSFIRVKNYLLNSLKAIGRLCEKCDGKCVICDSYVRPCTLVRVCDECNYGTYQGKCVICGGAGISDAYYCKECTIMEKDRGNLIDRICTICEI